MTSETQAPAAPYSTSPYSGPPAGYRAPPRPPLSPREKRGAFWAGAVGFNLLTLGFMLVVVPIVIAAFGVFFAVLFEQIARSSDSLGTGYLAVRGLFASIDFGIVAIIGIVVVVIGLAIMAAALFVSKTILRSHGVARPWPVTWAAAGIAIVAYWILGWIPALIPQFLSMAMSSAGLDETAAFATTGAVTFIVAVAVNAVIGWLAWWWMAHALRRTSAGASATAIDGQE